MIGLALAGGGVKGSYEAGAYMAFRQCHISFDAVTGTSIGAFNAAMIVAKKDKELFSFWHNINVASILGLNGKIKNSLSKKDRSLINGFHGLFEIIKNKGLDVTGLENILKEYDIENSVKKSNIDFGVCTFRINNQEPLELFKKDIPKGKIEEFILASCYLPIFKPKKLIDDSFYFDGGIYDNCPANMLLKKGYDLVYRVELNAIGRKQKLLYPDKVITISPSRKLSPIISLDTEEIVYNFWVGYYDTLKVLKKYPGSSYLFKKRSNFYYKFLLRKVPSKVKEDMMAILYASNEEELVLKTLEFLMINNHESYFSIYNPRKLIKKYKKVDNIVTNNIMKYL